MNKTLELLKGLINILDAQTYYTGQDYRVYNMLDRVINDRWITVHPHGKDEKGQPLLVKDGETNKEAIERTYGTKDKNFEKDINVSSKKEPNLQTTKNIVEIKNKVTKNFKGKTDIIEKAFINAHNDNATNKIIDNFDKLGKIEFKKVDLDKGCFIPPFASELSTIKADSEYTFYHEFGHSLDCRLGKELDKNNPQFSWLSMELTDVNKEVIEKLDYKLPKDLEKTFKRWDNKVKLEFSQKYIDSGIFSKEILDKARQKYKNFDNLPIQLKSSILDEFGRKSAEKYFKQVINSNPDYKKWSVLSDIYSALTMGRDNKDKFLGKHSQEYWEDANFGLRIGKSANINSEIFANYVEMRMGNFTEQLKYLKDNEPKLYNKLDLLYNKVATEIEKL